MKCDLFIENFDANDALSPTLSEEMRKHMRSCPDCAAYVENVSKINAQLRALSEEEPPTDFIDSMKRAVVAEKTRSRKGRKFGWKAIAGLAAAAVVVVGAFSLIGSTKSRDESYNYLSYAATPQATAAIASESAPSYGGDYLRSMDGGGVNEIAYDMAEVYTEEGESKQYPTPQPDAGNNAHGVKIIRTGNISLETSSFDADYQGVQDLIAQYGGYAESLSVYGTSYSPAEASGGNRHGSITARIPSADLDAFIGSARNTGNVTNISVYSEDVTARYQDTELRLSTLYAQHDRLLELIGKATEITDLIALEQKMQEIQYQIDSYTGTLKGWDARVDYSTVYFNVVEVRAYSSTESDSLSERMSKALQNSVEGVKEMARSTAVWAAGAVPYLAVLAVLGVIGMVVWRGVRAAKKKK